MKHCSWIGALVLACLPALAAAQLAGSVQAPAGFAPMSAPCVKQQDASCAPVSVSAPLPITQPTLPSGKAAVTGQLTAAGTVGPFIPIAGRYFNVTIAGGTGVAAQLERSFDNGATWVVKYRASDMAALPPSFSDVETEVGVQYQISVTAIDSGTASVRLSQ